MPPRAISHSPTLPLRGTHRRSCAGVVFRQRGGRRRRAPFRASVHLRHERRPTRFFPAQVSLALVRPRERQAGCVDVQVSDVVSRRVQRKYAREEQEYARAAHGAAAGPAAERLVVGGQLTNSRPRQLCNSSSTPPIKCNAL